MDESVKKFIEEQNKKLAIMVAQGFEATKKDLKELRTEMTAEFSGVRKEMATKDDIAELQARIVNEGDIVHECVRVLETQAG